MVRRHDVGQYEGREQVERHLLANRAPAESRISRQCSRIASITGVLAVFPSASTLANIGVSSIFNRITRPTATKIRLATTAPASPRS